MKDILLGAIDLYNWDTIKPWVKSIRETGFDGDIYLICYRIDDDIYDNIEKYKINSYTVNHTPYGTPINHQDKGSPTQAHNYRFYHAWELLHRLKNEENAKYQHVIMTDVRDVVFQRNPSEWLSQQNDSFIVAPSEGIQFSKEEWNKTNMIRGFGELFWNLTAQFWTVYNVGTIAGSFDAMHDLFHTIFRMTEGRYYPSDQSSFNVLVHGMYSDIVVKASQQDGWAAQMGTAHDPTKSWLWERLNEPKPVILSNGNVVTQNNELYCMVHQWDRVPQLKKIYNERFA